jgi:hypothetical protein
MVGEIESFLSMKNKFIQDIIVNCAELSKKCIENEK